MDAYDEGFHDYFYDYRRAIPYDEGTYEYQEYIRGFNEANLENNRL